jgi:hypothetical protein
MASALNTKINSYAIQRGFEYADNPVTINPVRTGTNPLNTTHVLSTPNPIYVNDGPLGGNGCVQVQYATTGNGTPTRINFSSANHNTDFVGIADGDWSMGFWFKYTSLPTGTGTNLINPIINFNGTLTLKVTGSSATAPNASKILVSAVSSSTNSAVVNETILVNTWYYFAITRTNEATNNYRVYLNGTLRNTFTNTTTPATNPFGGGFGTNSSQNTIATLRACNFYLASTSVIGPNEIAEIWTVGSTPPSSRTVKYFNGTSWVDSTGQKVWNGTAWVDWNAKRFDGSAWVNV